MRKKVGRWTTLSSKIVHKNSYYSVREDAVIKPDGSEGFYHVVEAKGAVFIVALDDEQNVYFVGLYRYTIDAYSLEIPAGGTDGEDPLAAAKRELREEAGLTAGTWKQLGVLYPANGILNEKNYVYLATDLQPVEDNDQVAEGIDKLQKISLKEALRMIHKGEIVDSQSIAGLALAALELGVHL